MNNLTSQVNSFKVTDGMVIINCIIPTSELPSISIPLVSGVREINLITTSGMHKVSPKLHKEYTRILLHRDYSLFKNVLGEYTRCSSTTHYFNTLINNLPAAFYYLKLELNLDLNNINLLLKFLESEESLMRVYKELKQYITTLKN